MPAPIEIRFPIEPLPVHQAFHASNAKIKVAIGGVGSGKTAALCMEAIRFALGQPGSDMILTRRGIPDLRRTTEKELFEVMPAELEKRCKIRRQQNHVDSIRFPNGSLLQLVGMESWESHKSMNLSWIGIDEASEQTRFNVEGIMNRLRQPRPLKGAPPLPPGRHMVNQMAIASNPAGQDFLYEMFVDPNTRRSDSSLHLSTPMDNPFLPPTYIDLLLQMPVPYIRRFVECRFDAAAGRVYPEWAWDTHVLPAASPGTYGDLLWMGMDPGILSPTAGLWVEIDRTTGRMTAVSEYQEEGRAAKDHAASWRAREASFKPLVVARRVADPAISRRDAGTTMELADIYKRLGYNFERGALRQDVRIPALANAIASGMFVCTESCPQLYEQIANARWEDQLARLRDLGDFREQIKKGNDHLHDCAQYLTAIHVRPAGVIFPQPRPASEPNDVEREWAEERARAQRADGDRDAALHQERMKGLKEQVERNRQRALYGSSTAIW